MKVTSCAFCSNTATHVCKWPVEKPTSISHWDLEEEHCIITSGSHKHLQPLTVRRFTTFLPFLDDKSRHAGVRVPVTMYALRFPDDRYFLYYLWGRDQVEVFQPQECAKPVCDLHLREVSETKHYCMEHWDSWQMAEAA